MYSFNNLLYSICYIGLAVVILRNEYSHILSLCLFIFPTITILVRIIYGYDVNAILTENSRNYISVLLLSSLLLYYISCFEKKKKILLSPALIYFYICICANGRGGILISAFMVIAILLYKCMVIKNNGMKVLMVVFIALVFLGAYIFILCQDEMYLSNYYNVKLSGFSEKGMDSNGRSDIWNTFLINNKSSISYFLFASNTNDAMKDGNLHNSFLQGYASFGVLGFLILVIFILNAFITIIKKKDFFLVILFMALLLRAFTDRVFFQGYCEPYLYYFIFYSLYCKRKGVLRESVDVR